MPDKPRVKITDGINITESYVHWRNPELEERLDRLIALLERFWEDGRPEFENHCEHSFAVDEHGKIMCERCGQRGC